MTYKDADERALEWVSELRCAHVYLDQGKPFFSGKDCAELADLIEALTSNKAAAVAPTNKNDGINRALMKMRFGTVQHTLKILTAICKQIEEKRQVVDLDSLSNAIYNAEMALTQSEKPPAPIASASPPEPDCWAILTPNGSRLVSPEEAKGRRDAYPLYAHPAAAQPSRAEDK